MQPNVINEMDWKELSYWNEWHELMEEKEKEAFRKIKKPKGK